jgi:thiol-disulfide isomerase/thioredoxin
VSRATVFVHPVRLAAAGQPRLDDALQTVTGPDGTFAFPQVPPGPVCVRVHLGPWQDEGFRSAPSVPLELRPGERAQLALGSGGATLTGRVRLTGMVPAGLDCTYSLNHLVRREAGIAPPAEVAAAGFDVRHGWRQAWEKTPEGHTYLSTLHSWFVKLAPDGSFRVSGVPPGEYDLSVAVYGKPNGCLIDPLARRVVRVAVTAADAARGEVALPDTMAEVVPVPAVGDTPDLSFARPDGTSGVLAEFRGKPIVLHFWASWCLSCKAQLPALKALHQRFPDRGVAVLGLALDEDPAAWHAALESLQLPWAQGRAAASRVPGVSSVPAYWLLDPAGRIVAKTYDVDELARALDDVVK